MGTHGAIFVQGKKLLEVTLDGDMIPPFVVKLKPKLQGKSTRMIKKILVDEIIAEWSGVELEEEFEDEEEYYVDIKKVGGKWEIYGMSYGKIT